MFHTSATPKAGAAPPSARLQVAEQLLVWEKLPLCQVLLEGPVLSCFVLPIRFALPSALRRVLITISRSPLCIVSRPAARVKLVLLKNRAIRVC